jgi:effector-binding domain-containing protein
MSSFAIRDIPRQHTAVTRTHVPIERIGEVYGEELSKVMAVLGEAGVPPAGAPICVYLAHGDDGRVEVEIGIPVGTPIEAAGDVVPSEIGGGEVAVGVHVGPYHELGSTYDRLGAWIGAQGRTPASVTWDSYVDDPAEVAASELRTEVYWALA